MFRVTPIFYYEDVYQDNNERLDPLDEIDYLESIKAAVNGGQLSAEEARDMVEREEELNNVR